MWLFDMDPSNNMTKVTKILGDALLISVFVLK